MVTITVGLPDGSRRRMSGSLEISLVDGCLAVIRGYSRMTGQSRDGGLQSWEDCSHVVTAYAPGEWDWVEREDEG